MSFAIAAGEYRRVGSAVFAPADPSALGEASDPLAAADRILARSQQLERTAGLDLQSGDADVRELAALQLAAAAALDVAAAADTLRLTNEAEGTAGGAALDEAVAGAESEFEAAYVSLRPVLEADTALGARAALGSLRAAGSGEEAGLDDGDAVAQLRAAAEGALEGISADAAKIVGHAVDGLADIPQDALLGAFGDAPDRLLSPIVEHATRRVRIAVRYLLKAVSKLLRLLGPIEPVARRWLKDRLGELSKDKVVGFVTDRALDVPRLRAELGAAFDRPTRPDEERLDVARADVEALAKRFGRHAKIARVLAKVLDVVRGVLLGLAPWVAAALAGVYLLAIGYGIWVAGDYLDWHRTEQGGRLDLVAGLRSTVELGLGLGVEEAGG